RREMRGKMGRASTTTKVNAAAPEGRSATRSGYRRRRRDANQKNRSDANGKLSHNAQLRCPWCVYLLMRTQLHQQEEHIGRKELACDVQLRPNRTLTRCRRVRRDYIVPLQSRG